MSKTVSHRGSIFEEFKICVLGSGGVGKSALTVRLITDEFLDEYDPTIEDVYTTRRIIDNLHCQLTILDTAGQEEFAALVDEWIRDSEGFLLVYDVTNKQSFQDLHLYFKKIQRCKDDSSKMPPIVIAGNKVDLIDRKTVSLDEAYKLAETYNSSVIETSAKEKIANEECFDQLVKAIKISRMSITENDIKLIHALDVKYCKTTVKLFFSFN